MKRKCKKIKKTANHQATTAKSVPTPQISQIKLETTTETENGIKQEPIIEHYHADDTSPLIKSECSNTNNDSNDSLASSSESSASFLYIELKLISIDSKCVDYERLEERFLCVDAKAHVEHIKKFILNKMNIGESLFEVNIRLLVIMDTCLDVVGFFFQTKHAYLSGTGTLRKSPT